MVISNKVFENWVIFLIQDRVEGSSELWTTHLLYNALYWEVSSIFINRIKKVLRGANSNFFQQCLARIQGENNRQFLFLSIFYPCESFLDNFDKISHLKRDWRTAFNFLLDTSVFRNTYVDFSLFTIDFQNCLNMKTWCNYERSYQTKCCL